MHETDIHLDHERREIDKGAADKFAQHQRYSVQRMLTQNFALIEAHLPSNASVLDVGSGVGDFLDYLCTRSDKRICAGIDLSGESVKLCSARLAEFKNRCTVVEGNAESLISLLSPWGLVPFGSVVMRGVVHHLASPEIVFKEIFNVLEPAGSLIILEGNVSSLYRRMVLGLADLMRIEHEASQFPHTPHTVIQEYLHQVGFSEISVSYVPGTFVPLAYLGMGTENVWNALDSLNAILGRVATRFFGWWYLMVARKSG